MSKLITDYGYVSLNKYTEELCGDNIEKIVKDDSFTLVLADGLGSGVKANILSTLTSKILATLISNDFKIKDATDMLLDTLPVCKVRNVAYSTFSITKVTNGEAILFEFDNPRIIYLRNGKEIDLNSEKQIFNNKIVYESHIKLQQGDVIIMISDGVIHAGIGQTLNLGFTREEFVKFLENTYDKDFTAKQISLKAIEFCNQLYQGLPGDDTSCAVIKIVEEKILNLMIGPPSDKSLDDKVVGKFLSKKGKKIVCGGTTSSLVAKFLNKEIDVDLNYYDLDVPPIGHIDGIDLTTEGILTLKKALCILQEHIKPVLSKDFTQNKDGASLLLTQIIKESTTVNVFVGRAINEAHQDSKLSIDFNTKLKTIENFCSDLVELGKIVNIEYY